MLHGTRAMPGWHGFEQTSMLPAQQKRLISKSAEVARQEKTIKVTWAGRGGMRSLMQRCTCMRTQSVVSEQSMERCLQAPRPHIVSDQGARVQGVEGCAEQTEQL